MQDRTDPNVAASAPVDIDAPKGAIPEAGLLGRGIDRIGILFAFAILASAAILGIDPEYFRLVAAFGHRKYSRHIGAQQDIRCQFESFTRTLV